MTKLKTVNIKGKEYVEVNERVKYFKAKFPNYSLETELIKFDEKQCVVKAIIKDDKGIIRSTGLAFEDKASSFINKTSYLENCETSAVGRALGFLGIGIEGAICSAEEVQNAIENQKEGKSLDDLTKVLKEKPDISKNDVLKMCEKYYSKASPKQLDSDELKDLIEKINSLK